MLESGGGGGVVGWNVEWENGRNSGEGWEVKYSPGQAVERQGAVATAQQVYAGSLSSCPWAGQADVCLRRVI